MEFYAVFSTCFLLLSKYGLQQVAILVFYYVISRLVTLLKFIYTSVCTSGIFFSTDYL